MVVLTFSSCKFIKSKEDIKPDDTTTSVGTTAVTEKTEETSADENTAGDGESITVFVTDKDGEIVTNKDGSAKTEKVDLEQLEKELEKELENQSTTKSGTKTTKKSGDTSADLGTQSSEEDLLPDGTKTNNTTLTKTIIEPVLKSGTYTIKGNIKAEGQAIGAQIAFRNGKDYSVQVSMSVFSVRVFCNNGKYYMALPSMGKYAEIAAEDVGDIGDMSESFKANDAKYVKTTTVKDGKQTYTCEEYKTSTGTAKYYFNSKNEWKRMEIIEDDTILVWEITSFAKAADKTLFEVNKLWMKDSSLAGMF